MIALLALPAPLAHAESTTSGQLRNLARQAADGNQNAREQLDQIDQVDGHPADIRNALKGSSGKEEKQRLQELSGDDATGSAGDPAGVARGQAQRVLDDGKYKDSDVPHPLRGVFKWIGDRFTSFANWIRDRINSVPGPSFIAWGILGLILVALAWWLTRKYLARRALAVKKAKQKAASSEDVPELELDDATLLERAAERAEAAGDFELAVRLRFKAGLLRLDERELVTYRDSLTTGEVARVLGSERFDALGRRFDQIVYGRQAAAADDATDQRSGWTDVLAESKR